MKVICLLSICYVIGPQKYYPEVLPCDGLSKMDLLKWLFHKHVDMNSDNKLVFKLKTPKMVFL